MSWLGTWCGTWLVFLLGPAGCFVIKENVYFRIRIPCSAQGLELVRALRNQGVLVFDCLLQVLHLLFEAIGCTGLGGRALQLGLERGDGVLGAAQQCILLCDRCISVGKQLLEGRDSCRLQTRQIAGRYGLLQYVLHIQPVFTCIECVTMTLMAVVCAHSSGSLLVFAASCSIGWHADKVVTAAAILQRAAGNV